MLNIQHHMTEFANDCNVESLGARKIVDVLTYVRMCNLGVALVVQLVALASVVSLCLDRSPILTFSTIRRQP